MEILYKNGHYEAYDGESFIVSGDTKQEVEDELSRSDIEAYKCSPSLKTSPNKNLTHTLCVKSLDEAYSAVIRGRYYAASKCIKQFFSIAKDDFPALRAKAVVIKNMIA